MDLSIGATSAQRCNTSNYDIVPTFCQRNNLLHFVKFDGWYYVCTPFVPVNMPYLGQNRADAGSIDPVLAQLRYVLMMLMLFVLQCTDYK